MSERLYQKHGKPVIHSSQIALFLNCPFSKTLSELHESEASDEMKKGLIIERLVFGDHDNQLPKLLGRRKAETVEQFEKIAEMLKPYFFDGQAFHKIEARKLDCFCVGEVDYQKEKVMQDLKIYATHADWERKNSKEDFLQAIYYNYIRHLNNEEIQDFEYIVYSKETSLIKKYVVKASAIAFTMQWIEEIVNNITENLFDVLNTPEANYERCLEQKFGVCRYYKHCKTAQEYFLSLEKQIESLT